MLASCSALAAEHAECRLINMHHPLAAAALHAAPAPGSMHASGASSI